MISYPPTRTGRSHEARANGEGCGACGFGLASRAPGGLGRHCPAQLCGSVGATRLVGVDERGGKPAESRAFRLSAAPVRFQKAVPGSKEKRRSGAPRGAPVRVMDRQLPPAGGTGPTARRATWCGVPHQRLSALRSLTFGEGASPCQRGDGKCPAHPAPCENRGGGALLSLRAGCLKRESDDRARKVLRAFWRNEPEVASRSRSPSPRHARA